MVSRFVICSLACALAMVAGLGAGTSVAADKSASATEAARASEPPDSSTAQIAELIEQLGSPEYTVRRAAASELRKIGPEAFDQLNAASEHRDPEVAASARYLLRQISVRWTTGSDSAIVRQLMQRYGDREEADRQRIIRDLAALAAYDGVAALCRVARFDRQPLLARLAALSIVQTALADPNDKTPPIDLAVFDRELGDSKRVPVLWLRQFQLQLRDPAASLAGWNLLLEEESKRLESDAGETTPSLVTALWWNLADVHRRLGDWQATADVGDRMIGVSGGDADEITRTFLQWAVERQAWDALDRFAERNAERIGKSKQATYLLAFARASQDDKGGAEKLAAQAADMPIARSLDGVNAAVLVASLGQFDWAAREYRRGIDDQPLEAVSAIGARVLLSDMLRDYEQYEAAAQAIEPLVESIEKNQDVVQAYETAQAELAAEGHFLPEAKMLPARYHYALANHHQQQRDLGQEREQLLKAIERDPTDADVLIAMYRLDGADEAWMTDTRQQIQKLAAVIDQEIEENPDNSIAYNQWAWLIANTEGDQQKAVRYSRKSLELRPATASFLDTLGRCYFAVGDLDRAIESQREAIALDPHMQVMHRQLKLFENERAAKQTKAAPADKAAKPN